MATHLKTRARDVVGVEEITPGRRLRTLRELMCMTQKQLEAASKVKQADISAIERDKKVMSLAEARKLARGLDVRLALLLGVDPSDGTDPFVVIVNAEEKFGKQSSIFLDGAFRLIEQVSDLGDQEQLVVHRRGAEMRYSIQPR